MSFPPSEVLAGQRSTAGALNAGFAIGRLVFFALRTAAQSIATGGTAGSSSSALSWDSVQLDTLGGWSSSSATRYTAQHAGWYTCTGLVGFASSASGSYRGCSWLLNGSAQTGGTSKPQGATAVGTAIATPAVTLPIQLDAGDYVQLAPFHNASGALDTDTGVRAPSISIYYSAPE